MGGRDSLVCLARCRLDGLGIEFPVAATFFAPDHAGPEVHPASCTIGTVPGPFSELERPRFGLEFPPPPQVGGNVKSGWRYNFTPLCAFMACYRRKFK